MQLDLSDNYIMRSFVLTLVALTPLLNTMTRVCCDPSLKQKLAFWKRGKGSVAESFIEQQASGKFGNGVEFKGDPTMMESLIDGTGERNLQLEK